MNVGVRELKQHLSEYLDRAAAGEVVQVTDRGVPKVQIVRIQSADWAERGAAEGWLRPPVRHEGLGPCPRFTSGQRVLDVLDDDRHE